ncbi:hypothetical protein Vadar_020600 [Vaccinium darrowii]|uniref:Uncharacterized protein n=1 Tax=Vaccinium darrowii TaxID=229202 RepID=A0ACB7YZ63_9ERIC|nr:hypothetical protein Vadar_020600 [Vaccinium darrowii]
MADLVTTARLYYDKSSWEVKKSAHDFFNSLDGDNDGKVSLHEFLGCMRELGHVKMGSSHFFNELDKDMNGTLEFMEVMALYYIIKSGRPFCSGCDEFIPGMYFSCSPNSSVTIAELEELPTSPSNAVVLYNQKPPPRHWKHAWKALEMALNAAFSAAAGAAATVATQAGFCTIM